MLKVGQGDVCEQGCWNHSHKQTALSAEGKSAILSPYFHYHHLILHNKHVGGGVGAVHPQMGSRKEEKKYKCVYRDICVCMCVFQG